MSKLPFLEELEWKTSHCYPVVGVWKFYSNTIVFSIAEYMSGLRGLCLQQIWITTKDVKAILDGYPLLETLDLTDCHCTDSNKNLLKQCVKRLILHASFG